jgi:ATP-dependent Lon protease
MNSGIIARESDPPEPERKPALALPDEDVRHAEEQDAPKIPSLLPIVPVRNFVVFPGTVVPLTIQRPASLKLVEENLSKSKIVGLVAQRVPENDDPHANELFEIGVAAYVIKLLRQPDNSVVVIVRALDRVRLRRFEQVEPYFVAEVEVLPSIPAPPAGNEWEAAVRNLRETAVELTQANPEAPDEMRVVIMNIGDPGYLADLIAGNFNIPYAEKQQLLEELDVVKRVRLLQERLGAQLEIVRLQQKLHKDVSSQFTDMQRRAYLREQVKAIQRELGESEPGVEEQVEQLRQKIEAAAPPASVMEQAQRELKRLTYIPPASPEYSIIVTYLETIAELPWNKVTEDDLDLDRAQKTLDHDHFGLEKVKRRIIEYLAVRKLNPGGRGPILCFLGPPGVGKTSLGKSIANALGRKFARLSLGGMHDEAEIRGHRRTYIGAMPGRLIQEYRRLGTRNPVIMLDEIDKVGSDFRGDPASALLEVLDPRQNQTFTDHYLDAPFDLSQTIFIATANQMDPVPIALRDRMEVIEIPGYTDREKLQIAKNYLVERQLEENGLKPGQCAWPDEALSRIIADYTREAGVRELERQVGAVCRAVAAKIARGEREKVEVTPALVEDVLGPALYVRELRLRTSQPGVVTGLAYTPVGGAVLYIEAVRFPGKGGVQLTGHIGEVMRESAQAALSLVRSRAVKLGIDPAAFSQYDIHVHVPSGAVPKDGPSAGVAMFTALASLFMDRPVRADVAMTGEITLRGLVLPIGGLKEKTLAAMHAGISQVVIPKLNEKDLVDIPEEVKRKLNFVAAETVDDVLAVALEMATPDPAP